MNIAQVAAAALLGLGYLIAHNVADHWVQTGWEAANKGRKDATGRAACLSHVVTYTFTLAAVACALILIFHLPITWRGLIAGLAISAVTHYWADRRFTLEKLTQLLGKHDFYKLGQPRDVKAYQYTRKSGDTGPSLAIRPSEVAVDPIPWDNPSLGTGAYALDQAWHWFFILVATTVTVVIP